MTAFPVDIVTALNLSAKSTSLLGSRNERPRVPFEWNSKFRQNAGIDPLQMRVNPNSVAFSQPKRITKKDTKRGSVYYHFSDDRGRDLDILELNISGVTGFVSAQPSTIAENQGDTLDKLRAWYNFYALSREPMLDPRTGAKNQIECVYKSVLLPMGVTFKGHFAQPLQFTDASEPSPFSKAYTVTLVVHETDPDLDTLLTSLNVSLGNQEEIDALIRDATTDASRSPADESFSEFLGLPPGTPTGP